MKFKAQASQQHAIRIDWIDALKETICKSRNGQWSPEAERTGADIRFSIVFSAGMMVAVTFLILLGLAAVPTEETPSIGDTFALALFIFALSFAFGAFRTWLDFRKAKRNPTSLKNHLILQLSRYTPVSRARYEALQKTARDTGDLDLGTMEAFLDAERQEAQSSLNETEAAYETARTPIGQLLARQLSTPQTPCGQCS